MGTDRTDASNRLMGLVLPMDLEVWTEESTITEADPIPSAVIADRQSGVQLTASGTPAVSSTLEIKAQRGGVPDLGATILHRVDGADDWLGWDSPVVVTSLRHIAADAVGYDEITMSTGRDAAVMVTQKSAVSGTGVLFTLDAWTRDDSDGTWTKVADIVTVQGASGEDLHPWLVTLPDGTIECYYLIETGPDLQVAKITSYDDGASWENGGQTLLEAAHDLSTGTAARLRVASSGSQVLLLLQTDDSFSTLHQYASKDGGHTFAYVGFIETDGADDIDYLIDLQFIRGLFRFIYWRDQGSSTSRLWYVTLGSAFTIASTESKVEIGNMSNTPGDKYGALVADETGTLWALYEESVGTSDSWDVLVAMSTDGGLTWSTGTKCHRSDVAPIPGWQTLTARWYRGQVLIAHQDDAQDLWGGTLGGWTNVPHPARLHGLESDPYQRAASFVSWYAADDAYPDDVGWAVSITGATVVTADGQMDVDGTILQNAIWTIDAGEDTNHAIMRWVLTPDSDDIVRGEVEVRPPGAALVSFGIQVVTNESAGTIEAFDLGGGSLGSDTLPSGDVEILIGVNKTPGFAGATGSAWFRDASGGAETRIFTALADAEALTDNGGTSSGDTQARFTVNETPGATGAWSAEILELHVNLGSSADADVTLGSIGLGTRGWGDGMPEADLLGRPLSRSAVYLQDGQSVEGVGLARLGDTWTHDPGHTYAAANALPTVLATPRRGFRSLTADQQIVALKRSDVDIPSRGLVAVYVDGANVRGLEVELHTGGAWSSEVAFLPATFAYESFGEAVIPDFASLSGDATWYDEDELAGDTFEFANGDLRRISGNRAGAWGPSDQVTPILYLEGIDGTEPTGTGTGRIWHRRYVVLLYLPSSTEWRGIRVTLDQAGTDDTVDGYVEADVIAVGEVLVFGAGPDETRAVAREIGPKLVELENGTMGEATFREDRRRVEVSWARSIPILNQADGSFDFVAAHVDDGDPVGDLSDAPTLVDGIVKRHGRKPLVYLPDIPTISDPFVAHILHGRAGGAIYGRIANSSSRIETVRGHAERCEVVRTGVLTIVEEGR